MMFIVNDCIHVDIILIVIILLTVDCIDCLCSGERNNCFPLSGCFTVNNYAWWRLHTIDMIIMISPTLIITPYTVPVTASDCILSDMPSMRRHHMMIPMISCNPIAFVILSLFRRSMLSWNHMDIECRNQNPGNADTIMHMMKPVSLCFAFNEKP